MPTVPGTTGSTLTFHQIEQLWIDNGGPPGWAPLMAAIAEAESGGLTNNLNNNASTGDFSVGLWQINYFGGLGPSRAKSYGQPAALAQDPNAQAKAAISIFGNGAGISAWQGDPAYKAWKAAGAPQQPSESSVLKWGIVPGGNQALGPAPGTPGFNPVSGGTATLTGSSGASGSSGDPRLCGTGDPGGIDIFGAHIGTKCQRKGLIGALLVGAGGAVMVIGVFVLVGKSSSVRGAAGAVVGGIAGGPAGAATGAKVGAATAPAPAPAPAPKSQSERNAERVAALPPEVREDARRRRVESGLQPA